ncbi:MAG: hypothetical protein ACTSQI_18195 [Candidatus Helarchaeota archaeon]
MKDQMQDWRIFQSYLLEKGLDPDQFEWNCAGFPAILQVDNSREFRARLVKQLCMDLNITLEFRPVRKPEYGGFIESIWDTINDGIRNAKLRGRVFSLPKSREPVKCPKYRKPPRYNAKDDAAMTLDGFREWLFGYIVIDYSSDTKLRQNHSPNDVWTDGQRGDRLHPMGGALRLADPTEYLKLFYLSRIQASAILSEKGLRVDNILYTSEWLNEARKNRILKDGEKYEFRVSHLDIRWVWIMNPATDEVETLEAYKFDSKNKYTNQLLTKVILRGLGKVANCRSFCISKKNIDYLRQLIEVPKKDEKTVSNPMGLITEKLARRGKLNVKDRRILENLTKTPEGRQKLTAAGIIAQLEDGTLPVPSEEPSPPISETPPIESVETEIDEPAEVGDSMTTDTEQALREMLFWDTDDEEEDEE